MDPLVVYDYLARARQRLFDWIRPLTAEQYTRTLPTWRRTLAHTLTHTMTAEWYYMERLQRHDVPPDDQWPIREEDPPPFAVLEKAWIEQAERTRTALGAVQDWNVDREYRVTLDDGRRQIIQATGTDIFTQLVLHEVHHRTQALNMLRQLGATTDDLDYNLLTYRRRDV